MLWVSAIPTTSTSPRIRYHTTTLPIQPPSKELVGVASFWDSLLEPCRITVASCRDCFRCFPLARQAGGSCSYACVLEECLYATASSMQPFQSLCGRLPQWSSLPEPSSL